MAATGNAPPAPPTPPPGCGIPCGGNIGGVALANAIVIQMLKLTSMSRPISTLSMLRYIKDPSPTNADATINANAMTNAIASIHTNVIVNANAFVHAMLVEILMVLNYMKDTGEMIKKPSDTTQSSNSLSTKIRFRQTF